VSGRGLTGGPVALVGGLGTVLGRVVYFFPWRRGALRGTAVLVLLAQRFLDLDGRYEPGPPRLHFVPAYWCRASPFGTRGWAFAFRLIAREQRRRSQR